jgi:hypothetical protein
MFLKYGAAFASAMISAGYMELREPEVVAMMEYIEVIMKSPAVSCDAP